MPANSSLSDDAIELTLKSILATLFTAHGVAQGFGKRTTFTNGVGSFAEVAHDLQQSLLECGSTEPHLQFVTWPGAAGQQSLARQAQHGIIFSGAPGKVTIGHTIPQALSTADPVPTSASIQPGQDYVHAEVRDTTQAKQALRPGEARGTQ